MDSKFISLDNGEHFQTAEEAAPEITAKNLWPTVFIMMDELVMEGVHNAFAPCTEVDFLRHYLYIAEDNLIID